MPVQFPDGTFGQMQLRRGKVLAGREVGDHLLAHPSAFEQSFVGVGQTPLQVRNDTVVGAGGAEVVGVLQVELVIGPV